VVGERNGNRLDAVTHVGLPDERSAALAATWKAVLGAGAVVRQIAVADLEALLAEYDRELAQGTLGPIADPAAYRRHAANIPQWRAITAALLELRRTIARVEATEAGRQSGEGGRGQ